MYLEDSKYLGNLHSADAILNNENRKPSEEKESRDGIPTWKKSLLYI